MEPLSDLQSVINEICSGKTKVSGYHNTPIPLGKYGEFSKVVEEMVECIDAYDQGRVLLVLMELSDLLGAISGYISKYQLTIADLIQMAERTSHAFDVGERVPHE
jgi:hypothetical protein